jgi:NADPH:quinone reductase-like Zn-dependent oxidoreductase
VIGAQGKAAFDGADSKEDLGIAMSDATDSLEIRSLVSSGGELRLSVEQVTLAPPDADEVIVRVEAAPINPSDLGLLLGPAELTMMNSEGTTANPILTMKVPEQRLASITGRLDLSMPVGNEGAGTVVAAGSKVSDLLGKKVGMFGGGMYAQFRKLPGSNCIVLPEGASAADGASMFINPQTALGFIETMKAEGHTAIVHAAAASNLGQMLLKICLADRIPLVNIVRSESQAAMLREIGATRIVNSTAPEFETQLTAAIVATGATLAFDPIGGGKLASQILNAMEAAVDQSGRPYSRYGSDTHKQVYVYGSLNPAPIMLERQFGFAWSIGGWLLFHFLQHAGAEVVARMRSRIRDELKTTFASHYTRTISLAEALHPDVVRAYQRKATGEKYMIDPTL